MHKQHAHTWCLSEKLGFAMWDCLCLLGPWDPSKMLMMFKCSVSRKKVCVCHTVFFGGWKACKIFDKNWSAASSEISR